MTSARLQSEVRTTILVCSWWQSLNHLLYERRLQRLLVDLITCVVYSFKSIVTPYLHSETQALKMVAKVMIAVDGSECADYALKCEYFA